MSRRQSLLNEQHELASSAAQNRLIEGSALPSFDSRLAEADLYPLRAQAVEVLQVNVGRLCNQSCAHCHVDAAPDRKEIMARETFEECIAAIDKHQIPIVDITGGAPEMNPHFRWFVEELSERKRKILVRCNLTILVANPKYMDLPDFYAKHEVEVISSLPYFTSARTDSQRGEGVFEQSLRALQLLNKSGFGMPGSLLKLNLVYNPAGAFLPGDQHSLELQFKKELRERYGIEFNQLFCITNMPISRFLEYLVRSGNYEGYMEKILSAFNPAAVAGIMCKNTISVGHTGILYDCDFNQMLDLPLRGKAHIRDFDPGSLAGREIVTGRHCFGCTAGAGSSCGGATA